MEPVSAPLLFSAIPTTSTSVGQSSTTEGSENDFDSPLVVHESILSFHAEYDAGLPQDSNREQNDNRFNDWESSSRPEKTEVGRRSDLYYLVY